MRSIEDSFNVELHLRKKYDNIIINLFILPFYACAWFICEKIIQLISGKKFSQKWSAIHSIGICVKCYVLLKGYGNLENIRSYFFH